MQETLTAYDKVGHVPRVISLICQYFLNYAGQLEGNLRDVRYRRSPIPKGGLKMPKTIVLKKHKDSPMVFTKMKELILEYYTEPENIKNRKSKVRLRSDKPKTIWKNLVRLTMLRQAKKLMQM